MTHRSWHAITAGVLVIPVMLGACAGDGGDEPAADQPAPAITAPPNTTGPAPTSAVPTSARATTTPAPAAPASTIASVPVSGGSAAPAPTTATPDLGGPRVGLAEVARLDEPVALAVRPGDPALYVAERGGRVRVVRDGVLDPAPVVDLSALTRAGGERGLLGLTFSPAGDRLYVDYTDPNGDSHVDELAVTADGTVDPATRRQVLFQEQPYPNHNGGNVLFGPDGFLYIGFGDGGSQGDPQRHGLALDTWLGKILRVDPRPVDDQPYTVPPDNPFVGQDGARPEIWSYGLRNPWRFAFDRATGDLWIADVGGSAREEVDRSPVAEGAGRGVNFGWSALEGTRRQNADQPTEGAVGPVYEYGHGQGDCSITGGFVYRGSAIPRLAGAYVFADDCRPGIRALAVEADGTLAGDPVALNDGPEAIASVGEGADGELYVLSLDGVVARLSPA